VTTTDAISLTQTLTVGSIGDFLAADEVRHLTTAMGLYLRKKPSAGPLRTHSIHEIPGLATAQAMAVYEPAGRIEITTLPTDAEALLQHAVERVRPRFELMLPSFTACRPWVYVEYGPGQHITSHVDGIAPDPGSWPRQLAGISVVVGLPEEGGDFYIETTSDPGLWRPHADRPDGYQDRMLFARDGADLSSTWFARLERTRWTTAPALGTALIYGSQLIHGTQPVRRGRCSKFISWLVADTD
jgi:hypothetical protein